MSKGQKYRDAVRALRDDDAFLEFLNGHPLGTDTAEYVLAAHHVAAEYLEARFGQVPEVPKCHLCGRADGEVVRLDSGKSMHSFGLCSTDGFVTATFGVTGVVGGACGDLLSPLLPGALPTVCELQRGHRSAWHKGPSGVDGAPVMRWRAP